jgi:hypothetical protein
MPTNKIADVDVVADAASVRRGIVSADIAVGALDF